MLCNRCSKCVFIKCHVLVIVKPATCCPTSRLFLISGGISVSCSLSSGVCTTLSSMKHTVNSQNVHCTMYISVSRHLDHNVLIPDIQFLIFLP